jgi:8-oxo-dGTP pyrophosphatase MutT (NUDIX family)
VEGPEELEAPEELDAPEELGTPDELIGLYDDAGHEIGVAPRSRMRALNLHHAATAVVVRDAAGRVYLHRRTDTKDVYPGRYDFAAGGVLGAGEEPYAAAERELAEELGISGVRLEPVGEGDYRDDHTSYRAFCFTVTWDGPVVWQPEEVAWGEWVAPPDLVSWVAREPEAFMPDTVALLLDWVRRESGLTER